MSIKRHENGRMQSVGMIKKCSCFTTLHILITRIVCGPSAMHQTFQKDLFKFRLKTAKLFLTSLKASNMPVSTNPNEPLKLNAQVNK